MDRSTGVTDPVFLISNSLIPDQGLPCAAPGLRVHGLYHGLRSHGVNASIILPEEPVHQLAKRWGAEGLPPQLPVDAILLRQNDIQEYLLDHGPCTAISTNYSGTKNLSRHASIRIGLDLFSATSLEHRYRASRGSETSKVIAEKNTAIAKADFFFVNGSRRVPYYHGWLSNLDFDLRNIELPAVNMCLPLELSEREDPRLPINLAIMGYDQAWAPITPMLELLETLAEEFPIHINVVAAVDYWKKENFDSPLARTMLRLTDHPKFTIHEPQSYQSLGRLLQQADIFLDLFGENIERYYSMSTRAIVALVHGVPVVHPGFTELGDWIAQHDAGWSYSGCDHAALSGLLKRVCDNPNLLRNKREGAERLAKQFLDPHIETAKILHRLGRH